MHMIVDRKILKITDESNENIVRGVRYERLIKNAYAAENACVIVPVDSVVHKKHQFLSGASDGLVASKTANGVVNCEKLGRLLEIKCPLKRVRDNNETENYYAQMQICMQCYDLYETDFVKANVREF